MNHSISHIYATDRAREIREAKTQLWKKHLKLETCVMSPISFARPDSQWMRSRFIHDIANRNLQASSQPSRYFPSSPRLASSKNPLVDQAYPVPHRVVRPFGTVCMRSGGAGWNQGSITDHNVVAIFWGPRAPGSRSRFKPTGCMCVDACSQSAFSRPTSTTTSHRGENRPIITGTLTLDF